MMHKKINNIGKWLSMAEDDEQTCRSLLKHRDAPASSVCFFSQQMAEKYLKTLLIHHQQPLSKIHDLSRLATLLEPFESAVFDLGEEFVLLNKFYIMTRYPADVPEGFSWKDAEEAFDAACMVKKFTLERL